MEVLSVGASCVQLLDVVVRVGGKIGDFVLKVRDARRDMDAVARELLSIKLCAESIKQDFSHYNTSAAEGLNYEPLEGDEAIWEDINEEHHLPPDVGQNLKKILRNATSVIRQLEELMEQMPAESLQGRARWALNGSQNAMRLRDNLEAHKCAWEIAIQLVTLALIRSIQHDTASTRATAQDIRAETSFILSEIMALRRQVDKLSQQSGGQNAALLQQFTASSAEIAKSIASKYDELSQSTTQTLPPPPTVTARDRSSENQRSINVEPGKVEVPLVVKLSLFGDVKFRSFHFERTS